MTIEKKIINAILDILKAETGQTVPAEKIAIQKTRKDFTGDFTLVVFPFVKLLRRPPDQCAIFLGEALVGKVPELDQYNVIKGFLNMSLKPSFWVSFLAKTHKKEGYGYQKPAIDEQKPVVVEYSSPNTNKPLHLGHIRNNLLGWSIASILEASGKKVIRVNLVNDRGIHICKSMLAWIKFGSGATPESTGLKGDKLVGDNYVRFERELRKQVAEMIQEKGIDEEEARAKAPLMVEAQSLLRRWEERDPEVVEVWEMMNGWVYEGFDKTYKRMGISFDKVYYESDTYLLGRDIVLEGLKRERLYKKPDGSVWANLSDKNLDDKLLLRADGTSVYITQDIGTAQLRYDDFDPDQMIYVVGNEQNHHFNVLKKVLKLLGKPFNEKIHHLSYGMVELPEGRMKSREGKVVDADDLMDEMLETAKKTTEELGKTDDIPDKDKVRLYEMIGLGALKYFILKVDPRKNILFNPEESIDFNGNTAPFIQYTYARISSILRTAGKERLQQLITMADAYVINDKERELLKNIYHFPALITEAAKEYSPALIANYVYDLCKTFNQFYHDHSVLNEPDRAISNFRLMLSQLTANVIRNGMSLLGIQVPERM